MDRSTENYAKVTQTQKDKSHVFSLKLGLFGVFNFGLNGNQRRKEIFLVGEIKRRGQLMESKMRIVKQNARGQKA